MCIVRFFIIHRKNQSCSPSLWGNSAFYEVMLLEEPRDIIVPLVIIAQHAHLFLWFYIFAMIRYPFTDTLVAASERVNS